MANIVLSDIETKVQNRLRNVVNSPITQAIRVSTYNDVVSFLQSKSNWNSTKRVATFEYLNNEPDYSLSNALSITDFKQYWDLRFLSDGQRRHVKEFEEIDGKKFSILENLNIKNNVVTFEDRDNDKVLRMLSIFGQGDTIIDGMEDLTTGRTWSSDTTTSDATTLAKDSTRAKVGNASLRYNISVSQSTNNRSTIYTSTSFSSVIDASDIENKGHFRFWIDLSSLTSAQLGFLTSVTFVWGSENSVTPATKANYWSRTATTTINNGTFKASWNRMTFDWKNATKTGSPDPAALKYFEIVLNYSASMTNANNVRIDEIKMFDPQEVELVYFSNFMVSKSGTLQAFFSESTIDTTEQLLLDQRHTNLVVNLILQILFPLKERGNADYVRVVSEAKEQLALAILQDGNSITREKYEFQVDGFSSGRSDVSGVQW